MTTLGGFIYTRSEYNAKGQLVKQYQDTGSDTEPTAPSLYEYDSFGNQVKQTLALSVTPTKDNSPVVEMAHGAEAMDDGIYSVTTQTRYNAEGTALNSTQKQLISQLSGTLASKSLSINERGLTFTQWSIYNDGTKRENYSSVPTSNITAESISIDGFTISQTDHTGITTTAIRKDGTWFAYGWDLTKNICEVSGPAGYIRTAYTYSPFGQVSASGDVTQPIQWSSEFYDAEPALVYYNYRHYNPTNGKWLGRDKIGERENFLLYKMVGNNPIHNMDVIGNAGYTKIACCVLRNLEKGDVDGARQCVQDEIEGIIKNFLHITALTCCVGPSALMGIGRSIVNGALQSIKNTSPKPCCP